MSVQLQRIHLSTKYAASQKQQEESWAALPCSRMTAPAWCLKVQAEPHTRGDPSGIRGSKVYFLDSTELSLGCQGTRGSSAKWLKYTQLREEISLVKTAVLNFHSYGFA